MSAHPIAVAAIGPARNRLFIFAPLLECFKEINRADKNADAARPHRGKSHPHQESVPPNGTSAILQQTPGFVWILETGSPNGDAGRAVRAGLAHGKILLARGAARE